MTLNFLTVFSEATVHLRKINEPTASWEQRSQVPTPQTNDRSSEKPRDMSSEQVLEQPHEQSLEQSREKSQEQSHELSCEQSREHSRELHSRVEVH